MFRVGFAHELETEVCLKRLRLKEFLKDCNTPAEVFLGKGLLKICSKFTGDHPHRSVISMKLQSKFLEIKLRHGCSPVNVLHIFRTPFAKNTL